MAVHKLIVDDDFEETFSLIAIHSTIEPYKLAYLLNKQLNLRLIRQKEDVAYSKESAEILFPLYQHNDDLQDLCYNLVANTCTYFIARQANSASLFGDIQEEQAVTTHLISEQKKVDYFLKIEADCYHFCVQEIITKMKKISQIISAYEVDIESLRSKNNLIFY